MATDRTDSHGLDPPTDAGLRTMRALLPWVPAIAADALYLSANVAAPARRRDFVALCRRARQKALTTQVAIAGAHQLQEPDGSLANKVACLTSGDTFVDHFSGHGGRVVSIPVAGMVTPQCLLDLDYVNELEARLPAENDEDALFGFCFPEDRLGEAVVAGGLMGLINVRRGQPPRVHPLRVESTAPSRVTFAVDVEARAGFIQVAAIPVQVTVAAPTGPMAVTTSRLVVVNGVHRLTTLLRAKRTHAYAIFLEDLQPQHLGVCFGQPPGPQLILDGVGAQRPPRLEDYLEDEVFDEIAVRAFDLMQRLVFQQDVVQRPRLSLGLPTDEEPVEVASRLESTLGDRVALTE